MATEARTFRIGVFVFTGALLIIAAIITWGALRHFQDMRVYYTYFAETVQGLEMNAPVKFQGIPIGRVGGIELAPDGKLVEVKMLVRQEFSAKGKNLVVRLRSTNISGIRYLEIQERQKGSPPPPRMDFDYAEKKIIPSVPSTEATLIESFGGVMKRINEIDTKAISDQLTAALARVNFLLASSEWPALISNLQSTAVAVKRIATQVDGFMQSDTVTQSIHDITATIAHLRAVSERIDPARVERLSSELTDLSARLNRVTASAEANVQPMLQDLQQIVANLRSFTESLRTRPSQTLFGQPPKEGQ